MPAEPFRSAKRPKPPVDFWMGWSNGRWDGDTLVVDVKGFNDMTWFDRAGNYHSDALHVVERYTPDHAVPHRCTRRRSKTRTSSRVRGRCRCRSIGGMEKDVQLLEFKCVDLSEEYLYGGLLKRSVKRPTNEEV